jgi:AcrR family transcriptional regulator
VAERRTDPKGKTGDHTRVAKGAVGPPDLPAPAANGRRRTKGEQTRRRLLDAAEQIFAAVGYHEASVAKITETAGVAQGTFYVYFHSKLEVFEEVVADLNHQVRRAMTEASKAGRTTLEVERLGFAGFFKFTAEHPALYRVIRQAEFVSPRALRQHYETIVSGYVPRLEAAMARHEIAPSDPVVLAWTLGAIGEMIGMRWILWNEAQEVPPEVFDDMMVLIGRLLGLPPDEEGDAR